MMNRSRKAILAVATITSLTLGSGVAVAQDNANSAGQNSSKSLSSTNGSSNGSSNSGKDGEKTNKSSVQELSTDSDGKELTLIGKLKVIGEVLALIGTVLAGAFGIYQTVTKIQKAMEQ